MLEIASGSGHHAAIMAAALPDLIWQPSEIDAAGRETVAARVAALALPNLRAPVVLDVRRFPWPIASADAVLCINMIHISPWEATVALFRGAAMILPPGGMVMSYGPYRFDGDFGAESNRAFDADLRARNPAWGVREVRDIAATAATCGFASLGQWAMPANNHILAFRKT